MLIDHLLKAVQDDRERQIAQARRERLATMKAEPEPEAWTWLREGPARANRTAPMRRVSRGQAVRPAADPSR
jgi:hypothetical protein